MQKEVKGHTQKLILPPQLGQEKNILVLVIGRVDFDAKKMRAQNKNDTEKSTESGIYLPVNHRHPRSPTYRVADMNVLGLKFMFLCTFST